MDRQTADIVKAIFGSLGGRILGSKGAYMYNNSSHVVTFNSNVYILRSFDWFKKYYENCSAAELLVSPNILDRAFGSIIGRESEEEQVKEWNKFSSDPEMYSCALEKVWYGDLDLTLEEDKLVILSRLLEASVFIVREMDGRFDNEKKPNIKESIYQINPHAVIEFDTRRCERNSNNQLIYKSLPTPSDEEIEKQKLKIQKSYKKKDFEIVDLKLHSLEDFDGDKEEYDGWNYFEVSRFFDNISKDITPYHNYINFLKDHLQVDITKDYQLYYITKEDNEALKEMFRYWLKVYDSFSSDYRIEQTIAWTSFDIGPNYFQETPSWAQEGRLYRKKG
jgi:hypothetical protein